MSLAPGTRIGSYEILAAIGAGGMGQVYRARDTKLAREVAIKVLPLHLATDPEARARFEREAKAVAALSHPNILAIHDFGLQDGIAYAVLELLTGETLRQRIASAPIPPRKALEIATQIAQGLSAAHEHDIAHRDLKPENIFVCADGRVKILDFGLAKTLTPQDGSDSSSATELRHTDPGTVMGTVGYMSPEQVRGLPADRRSDIFSFGCVLFEMLTGQRAFQGETAAETMTAILRKEPQEVVDAPVPGTLDPIVRHCLEKRPDDRFQSARDLAFVLQAQTTVSSSGTGRTPPVATTMPRPRRSPWPIAAIGAAVIAAVAFVAGRSVAPAGRGSEIRAIKFQQVTDLPGVETTPSLSPDGKSVVYSSDAAGNADLYLMRIGGRTPSALAGNSPLNDYQPAWSPEGERIAFRSDRDGGGIFIMTSTGESVRRLTDYGYTPSWSPNGQEIVVSAGVFYMPTDRGATVRGLWAVDVNTGKRRDIATAYEGLQPAWSPNGYRIAVWGLRGTSGQRDIWTFAADGSDATREGVTVTEDAALDWSPAWAPDGQHLYFSSNRGGTMNLWRIAIDERTGRVSGEPEPITTPSIWSGGFSLSRDGSTMAYASLEWRSTLLRVEFDAARGAIAGAPMQILKSTRPIRDHELSPDGEWVAFNETGAQEDLFVARIDGTQYRRLTDDTFRDRAPTWSPDGKQLVFYSDRSDSYELWKMRPDGLGLEQMTAFRGGANFSKWSPDGTRLAFSGVNANGWYLIPADAKSLPPIQAEPAFGPGLDFWPFSWSPDGTRIAGALRRTDGTPQGVAIYTLATKKFERLANLQLEDPFWVLPLWLADSRRLIVRDDHGVSIVDPAARTSRRLLNVRGYAIGRSMGVSKDNRWITYTETGTEGDIWIATLRKP